MKIIITERQLKLISEQSMSGAMRYVPQDQRMNVVKGMDEKMTSHNLSNILGLASFFIPVIGPIISTGIVLGDSAKYWQEGDKKTAALTAIFPFLPLGKLGNLVPGTKKLGKEGMEELGKKIGQGSKDFSQVDYDVIEGFSKYKDVLNQEMKRISDDLSKQAGQASGKAAGRVLGAFEKRFSLGECFAHNNCPALRAILSDFYSKLGNTAKLTKFYPSEVKVLSKGVVAGREVVETQLKDGTKVLFYKSSGSNIATTGKQAGEWFVIPGFAQNGWFFKTNETINLTKGGNKYLTDMAEFLQANGSQMLGR